jgi:hypothetical protein
LGTDVFIGGVPQSAPSTAWWIVSSGGAPNTKNNTAELQKDYSLNVYYRSIDMKSVYDKMSDLEIELNKPNCIALSGYVIIEVEAKTFPVDQDLDSEERTIGLIQVNIRTYYKE